MRMENSLSSHHHHQSHKLKMLRRNTVAITRGYATVQKIASSYKIPDNSTVFSMIQPTGKIHLGNYLGAVKSWKTISESESKGTKYIFGTADLHAITMPVDAKTLKHNRYEAIASLLASGIDNEKCILFHQSSVPEHTELNWYLTCNASLGHLNRMTQWKLKSVQSETSTILDEKVLEKVKAGLLMYPVLQAADVLLYNSTHVPVGEDQVQHLELTRSIAQTFNHTYGTDFFKIPNTLLASSQKVLSLRNPAKKMSKSDADKTSCVYVTDPAEEISKKIRRAVTDSIQGPIYFDPVERPGVSNMITIISGISGKSIEDTVRDLAWIKDHKQLKDHVTEVIVEEFKEKRHMYEELMKDWGYLESVCNSGRDRAREIATDNIAKIRKLIGLD